MTRLSHASREGSTATPTADGDATKIVAIVNVLLRQRRHLVWAGVVGGVLTAAIVFVSPRSYTTSASFIPQTRRPSSAIAGLAAQFNLAIPTGDATQSPAFYAELLQSRYLLAAAAEGPFGYEENGKLRSGTLVDVLAIKGPSVAVRREAAVDRLAVLTSSSVGARTGVIHIAATARTPGISLQIARRLLAVLDQFNMSTRRTQASAERHFTEQRLSEARSELRVAEDRLQGFLQRNRDFRNSPTLSFERDRLQNELVMRQQLYSSVNQAYEQARLDEVRDTPLITVIEMPTLPVKPDPQGLVRKTVIGGVLACVLTAAFLLLLRFTSPSTEIESPDPLIENARLREELAWELRHPWRLFFPEGRGRVAEIPG